MLKKTITYTDYDGNERTEDFYFNLTKAEIIELNLSPTGGLEKSIKKIIKEEDTAKIIEIIKHIILVSYGEKSLDGKRFVKTASDGHKLSDDFKETEAFSELFMELIESDKNASAFISGIIPKMDNKQTPATIAAINSN